MTSSLPQQPEPLRSAHYKNKELRYFHRSLGIFFAIFLLVLFFWGGIEVGRRISSDVQGSVPLERAIILHKDQNGDTVDFSLFWNAWEILGEKYVDHEKIDARELLYGAIKGMLAASGDPYTTFFDPQQSRLFAEDINGSFEGIGAEIESRRNVIMIVAPLDGSPAAKADLRPGDVVLEIGGKKTEGMSVEEAAAEIRGPKGTEIVLTIFREGFSETKKISITRDVITVKSVRVEFLEDDTIAHMRIAQFGSDTEREIRTTLQRVTNGKTKGIILDLRNNPGGFLDVAVNIASMMLPKDTVVLIEEDGQGNQKKLFTDGGDRLSAIPTVVLINEGSASAAEILAGALRDHRTNVVLIGEKSFGKGSVQELIPLPQETSMKVTVAKWLTPKGHQINEIGITPDHVIALTEEDRDSGRDSQLEKAQEIITGCALALDLTEC